MCNRWPLQIYQYFLKEVERLKHCWYLCGAVILTIPCHMGEMQLILCEWSIVVTDIKKQHQYYFSPNRKFIRILNSKGSWRRNWIPKLIKPSVSAWPQRKLPVHYLKEAGEVMMSKLIKDFFCCMLPTKTTKWQWTRWFIISSYL